MGWPHTESGEAHQDPETRLVYDFYCGAGGVGQVLDDLDDVYHVGFDIKDRSNTYPGRFVQADLDWQNNPCRGWGDLGWWSPPCTAYTPLSQVNHGSREKALEEETRISELSVQNQSRELTEYYIIENVPGATRTNEFQPNVKLNGLAFGKPFNLERHFETNFPCPDAYLNGEADMVLGGSEWSTTEELAEAKEVPKDWDRKAVNQAMPRVYVEWLLWYCPAVKLGEKPERVDSVLDDFEEEPLDPFLFEESSYSRDQCLRPVEEQLWFDPVHNDDLDVDLDVFSDGDRVRQSDFSDFS